MTLWVDSKYLFGNANWLALQSWPKLGCLLLLRLHLAGLTRLLAVYLPVPLLQNTTLTDATLTMDRTKTVPKCMPDSICDCSVGWVALTFQESHRTYALMRNLGSSCTGDWKSVVPDLREPLCHSTRTKMSRCFLQVTAPHSNFGCSTYAQLETQMNGATETRWTWQKQTKDTKVKSDSSV